MLSLTPTLAFILLAAGVLMLALELILPTGGIFFALSVLAIVCGITVAFLCGQTTGLYSLLSVFVALPIVLALGFYLWPRTPIGKSFILKRRSLKRRSPPRPGTWSSNICAAAMAKRSRPCGRPGSSISTAGASIPSPKA